MTHQKQNHIRFPVFVLGLLIAVLLTVSTLSTAYAQRAVEHSTRGVNSVSDGAGLAIGDINRNGELDAVFITDVDFRGQNQIRYRVLFDLNGNGFEETFSGTFSVNGMNHSTEGAGAALADIDGNGRLDLVVMTYNAPDGSNDFRYKIGYDLRSNGRAERWSDLTIVSGVGGRGDGAGVDVADINGDGELDIILMAYDDPDGANEFRYKVGFDLKIDGSVHEGWSNTHRVRGVGSVAEGAGITVADINRDGNLDILLMAYDAPNGPNGYRYVILWDVNQSGGRTSAGTWRRFMGGQGNRADGAGVDLADLDGDGEFELVLMSYNDPDGRNDFRYMVVHDVY